MVTALAALDPVACAELCAGHKAIANASMVRAAIEVLDALEGVIAPSGLFARLVELCPELGPELLQAAARRHPGAGWLVRMSRQFESVPGTVMLDSAVGADTERAVQTAVEHGLEQALEVWTSREGSPLPAVAWLRSGDVDRAAAYAARAMEADPNCPVIAWLAAVQGPDVQPLADAIAAHLASESAREALKTWLQ